ncbi:MAG: AtpZ/AtpI family protein [Microgenomates group bacterium]
MKNIYQIDKKFNKIILKKDAKRTKNQIDIISLAKSLNFGYYIITPIFLGIFFGLLMDNFFKTGEFYLKLFLFVGIISSFYNFWRFIKQNLS